MNDHHDRAFSGLQPGSRVTIVKLRPDGTEAASYPGSLLEVHDGWLVTSATWTFRRMEFEYATFEPGDRLVEYFPTQLPFNAFALFSDSNQFKCWYCNVAHPTRIESNRIYWHDLYLDVIQVPNGDILILDEDELAASNLSSTDPELHQTIEAARDLVVEKMRSGQYPFSEIALPFDY
jgi:uncharacterized protein